MNKYIHTLVKNVRKQLEVWLNDQEYIQNSELYRFLHSIAGTARTIGLTNADDVARYLMSQLNENENREWTKDNLQIFLSPLISIFYYEEFSNVDQIIERKEELGDKKLILLVDDDTTLIMNIKDVLEENGWVVIAVANPDKAIDTYFDLNPDCVIINIQIKENNGLIVLQKLKENMKQHVIPTIIISEDTTKETRIKSFSLGADDFIQKPFDIDELVVRIGRQLQRKNAIDELILIDELTRVYNRKFLLQSYNQFVSHLKRKNESFCIALVDLDHFKRINDTYGHLVGDKVLAIFANFLKTSLRQNDIIIRYGGEEFLLFFADTRASDAKNILDQILDEFSKTAFTDLTGNQEFFCSFSAGVHEILMDELDLKRNIEIADSVLYEAKNEGRNRVKIVSPENIHIHKKRIYVGIVDDDPIIRTILSDLISKSKITEGFTTEIKSFKDGMEFYDSNWYLQNKDPYLIILDGMMPRMDGVEVLQRLRKLPNHDRFTIIMLTSRNSEQDISRAIQLGADDYITKPFRLLELETRLGHLLKRM